MPIDDLQQAVERAHHYRASLLESRVVTARYTDDGEPVSRHIKTFALQGHSVARRAYAWQRGENPHPAEPEYSIVLGTAGVNSAEDALRLKLREIWNSL
jgi:hypothetical protein